VPVDERVERLTARAAPHDLATATKAIDAPSAAPRLAAGFTRTGLPVLNTAVKLMGFRTAVLQGGQTVDPAQMDEEMRADSSPWAAVLTGDAESVAAVLDEVPSATVRFVSADAEVLEVLGLDPIDEEQLIASESGHSSDPDAVVKALEADGYRCQAIALALTSGANVAVLDVVARVSRDGSRTAHRRSWCTARSRHSRGSAARRLPMTLSRTRLPRPISFDSASRTRMQAHPTARMTTRH
jgi:hypothetical protein